MAAIVVPNTSVWGQFSIGWMCKLRFRALACLDLFQWFSPLLILFVVSKGSGSGYGGEKGAHEVAQSAARLTRRMRQRRSPAMQQQMPPINAGPCR